MNQSHYKINIIILTGGRGERIAQSFNDTEKLPKQFLEIHGIPLFLYSVNVFKQWESAGGIAVVYNPDYKELTEFYLKKYFPSHRFLLAAGGKTRHKSVLNGIRAFSENEEDLFCSDWMIHDGARPNVSPDSLIRLKNDLLDEARKNGGVAAVTLAERSSETLVRVSADSGYIQEPLNREEIFSIKTPQALTGAALKKLYHIPDSASITDLSTWAAAGKIRTRITEIPAGNIKITWPDDLKTASALLKPFA